MSGPGAAQSARTKIATVAAAIRRRLEQFVDFLRRYDWKGLWPAVRRGAVQAIAWLRASPPRLARAARNSPQAALKTWEKTVDFHNRLRADGELRFRVLLWSTAIILGGGLLLAGMTPGRILLPVLGFTPPRADARQTVEIYAAARESGRPILVERKFQPSGDLEGDLRRAALLVAQPGELAVAAESVRYAEVEALPDLGQAIRKIWRRENGGRPGLIIDLREETLILETAGFISSRQDNNRNNAFFLDAFFSAYTATIFRLRGDIESVEYRLEGRRRAIPEMQFALDRRYLRGSVKAIALTR